MTLLQRGEPDSGPGFWKGAMKGNGARTAMVSCPTCGRPAPISDHDIAPDGTVSPSLVCPFDCGFHDYVQLAGWDGGA